MLHLIHNQKNDSKKDSEITLHTPQISSDLKVWQYQVSMKCGTSRMPVYFRWKCNLGNTNLENCWVLSSRSEDMQTLRPHAGWFTIVSMGNTEFSLVLLLYYFPDEKLKTYFCHSLWISTYYMCVHTHTHFPLW